MKTEMVLGDLWCQISAVHFMWSFTPAQSKYLIAFGSWFISIWHLHYNVEMTLQCAKQWKKHWFLSWLFPGSLILRFHSKGNMNSSHPDCNSLFVLICVMFSSYQLGKKKGRGGRKGKRKAKSSCVEFTDLIHRRWLWNQIKTRPCS